MTSGVWPALCGDSTTLGSVSTASSGFSGSSWKTSRPAPAIRPFWSASSRASRSTSAPAPGVDQDRGLLHEGQLATREEAAGLGREPQVQAHEVGLLAGSRPWGRAGRRDCGCGSRRRGRSRPAPPCRAPWTARSRVRRWCRCRTRRASCPGTESASRAATRRRASRGRSSESAAPMVSMSAIACSATAKALTPGVLQTVIPRRPAASRSMLSVPVPHTETILRSRQAAKTPSLKRAWARMLTATRARSDALDQLGLVVGAAGGDHAGLADLLRALVGRGALEDAGEVVGYGDQGLGHLRCRSRRRPARRRRLRPARPCARDRAGPARAPTTPAGRTAGWR